MQVSRLVGLTAAVGAAVAGYSSVLRPRIDRWGATGDEIGKPLPGDELPPIYGDRSVSTRAITIDASPEEIWPWIVQMGSGRAGFYTHEWVERALGVTYGDGHSSVRIHPEWQHVELGDRVPYSRFSSCLVRGIDPPHYLNAGEWLVLEPIDGGRRTRLIARTRGSWLEYAARIVPGAGRVLGPIAGLVDRGPGELLHHYMETGMLKGLKARAEATHGVGAANAA